jgi:tetratricopeptide (TPR) repeat protein
LYLRFSIIFLSVSLAVITGYLSRGYLDSSVQGYVDRGEVLKNTASSGGGKGRAGAGGTAEGYEGTPLGGLSPAFRVEALSEVARMHADLGRSYEKAGGYNEAFSEYTIALKYNPSDILILKKVEALLELLTREAGETVKDVAVHKPGGRPDGERELSTKLKSAIAEAGGGAPALKSPDYTTAVEELNRILTLVPSHMDTKELVHLSERAATEMEKAVVESHQQKGIDYFIADDMEAAIKVWDAVLKLDPGNKAALEYKKRAEVVVDRLKEIKEKKMDDKSPM